MSVFRLKPKHMINVPQFDEEHHQLVEITDLLRRELIEADLQKARQTFVMLGNHTRIHFANEERAMQQSGYPGYHAHRAIHQNLLAELAVMGRQLDDWRPSAAKLFNNSIAIWLVNHIATEDAKLGKYLNARQSADADRTRAGGTAAAKAAAPVL